MLRLLIPQVVTLSIIGGSALSAQAQTGLLQGRVVDASGLPISGATVAAVPFHQGSQPKHQLTKKDGSFRFNSLTPGLFALTVTAPGYTSIYRGKVQVIAGALSEGATLRLEKGGQELYGRIVGASPKALSQGFLRVRRISNDVGDIFFVPLVQGRFKVNMSPGDYLVGLDLPDYFGQPLRVAIPSTTGELTLQVGRSVNQDRPGPAIVDAWIRNHAVPLTTVEAGHGFIDMQPLKDIVGTTRVVALGEATHGSREFFQLKHRVLEFLVSEMNFTTFAIEANQPEARILNTYVTQGQGDPAKGLAGLYFWTWDTEEVLEQIRWMRRWNENPSHIRKLSFQGFDMQTPSSAVHNINMYLKKVSPVTAEDFMKQLGNLESLESVKELSAAPSAKREMIYAATVHWLSIFDSNRTVWIQASSPKEFEVTRQDLKVVSQYAEMIVADLKSGSAGSAVRDRAMADNVKWILDQEGPQGKMVVWAHNFHISKLGYGGVPSMGNWLSKWFKHDYMSFGFSFYEGKFQAIAPKQGLIAHEVSSAPQGTLDAALARTGYELLALDLRKCPTSGPVADWFGSYLSTRGIGAMYNAENPRAYMLQQQILAHYDGLLFVKHTSRATPTPTGYRGPSK